MKFKNLQATLLDCVTISFTTPCIMEWSVVCDINKRSKERIKMTV
jgi:hypothetical protein